jgi:fatty acid desaturase
MTKPKKFRKVVKRECNWLPLIFLFVISLFLFVFGMYCYSFMDYLFLWLGGWIIWILGGAMAILSLSEIIKNFKNETYWEEIK